MVRNITSLSRNGLADWLIQRVTAVIVASYVIFLLAYLICNQPITFIHWYELYANLPMRIYTLLVLFSLLAHTWIGMWTIFTDYIKQPFLRLIIELVVIIALLIYLFWGIYLLFVM